MEIVLLLLLVVGVLWALVHVDSPALKGKRGEARVLRQVSSQLDAAKYISLHDLTLPTKNGTTQIDHVILSQFGIFVVETKNKSGWIFGSEDQKAWTQVIYGEKYKFQNPLRQNYGHIKAVQSALDVEARHIHGFVAFVGDAEPKTAMPSNVVWHERTLVQRIRAYTEPAFNESQVDEFRSKLRTVSLEPGKETNKQHVQNVKKMLMERNDSTRCAKCGGKMILRSNRRTGEKFWGCGNFPRCRGTAVYRPAP